MLHLHTFIYTLQHKIPFTTAYGSRKQTDSLIVILKDTQGNWGIGEAVPVRYLGYTAQEAQNLLEQYRTEIETYDLQDAFAFWEFMKPFLQKYPAAQCALDIAAHDLLARKVQKPLYQVWGLRLHEKMPLSNFTLSLAEPQTMIEQMQNVNFPIYKVKTGKDTPLQEVLQAIRTHTQATLRIDANASWSVEQTLQSFPYLSQMKIEFLEQPLAPTDWQGMQMLQSHKTLPIFADESCQTLADVEKCSQYFEGINLKLTKCGGLTPALQIIRKARKLGLQVMAGCMTESSVGISALAQLLPLLDYVDMDGSMLIANDFAKGIYLENGKAIFPNEAGIGVTLKQEYLSCFGF